MYSKFCIHTVDFPFLTLMERLTVILQDSLNLSPTSIYIYIHQMQYVYFVSFNKDV